MRLLNFALILALVSGCTVYKSSDRDDFDANGKSRAPVAAAVLSQDDRDLLANPCAALNAVSDDQLKNLFGPAPRLSIVNEVASKSSSCVVTTETSDLTAPSVFACSWKPVSGERNPLADDFAVQTTEGELREQGFDVVTTTVVSGERLRMNCEAYVPTPLLIDDRRNGEPASSELAAKFSAFARGLAVETLPGDTQP